METCICRYCSLPTNCCSRGDLSVPYCDICQVNFTEYLRRRDPHSLAQFEDRSEHGGAKDNKD